MDSAPPSARLIHICPNAEELPEVPSSEPPSARTRRSSCAARCACWSLTSCALTHDIRARNAIIAARMTITMAGPRLDREVTQRQQPVERVLGVEHLLRPVPV